MRKGRRREIRSEEDMYLPAHYEESEPYLLSVELQMPFSQPFGPVVLDDSGIFVLGDNRDNARDGRFLGPISLELLHGRVEYRRFAYSEGIRWNRFP